MEVRIRWRMPVGLGARVLALFELLRKNAAKKGGDGPAKSCRMTFVSHKGSTVFVSMLSFKEVFP
jgi:hypothetical protein